MDDREVIAEAVCAARCNAGRPDPGKGMDEFIADAVLAALKASGRVIVPVEPTEAMVVAFYEASDLWFQEAYAAMIAAAKEPTDGR